MNALKTQIQTDEWVTATWEQFKHIASDPAYEKAKCYYDNGQLRIEVSIGSSHSRDNTVVILAVNLFCGLKGIPLNGLTNCSYRKEGVRECQPDVSYYIGDSEALLRSADRAQLAPDETSVVDLNSSPAPDLMIEIGG
jgi:Uma2 family endonuclease